MTSSRTLVVVLALGVAACTGDGTASSTTLPPPPETTVTTVVETTTTLVGTGEDTEDLDPAVRSQLDELIVLTQELRELAFLEPPDFDVVTRGELSERIRDTIQEDLEDVDADQALYVLLGLLEEGTDLAALYTDLLSEQVAGYYDLETRELVVPMRSESFSALERSTIVHELTHALADQHFDIAATSERLSDEERYDEAAALLALIEGDAVVNELSYLQTLSLDEQREMFEESLATDSTIRDSAPQFLVESLIFPYLEGPAFVQRLIELDGLEGVDAAYLDPPVSTEQILSPQDYGTDMPVDVSVPDVVLDGYDLAERSVWGELGFELMFGQVLGERTEAVNGWGGDEYAVLWNGQDVALVLTYAGDDPVDVQELEAALLEYAAAVSGIEGATGDGSGTTFSGDDLMWVGTSEGLLHFVAAGDPEAGADLVGQIAGPRS